jgi:hypothetical protein
VPPGAGQPKVKQCGSRRELCCEAGESNLCKGSSLWKKFIYFWRVIFLM